MSIPPITKHAMTTTLPIIDISPFLDPLAAPSARMQTAKALDAACRTVGFFYLSNHNIPSSELDNILALSRSFFARPKVQKVALRLQ